MKKLLLSIFGILGISLSGAPIKEGQQAYNFKLYSDQGKLVRLSDYKGKEHTTKQEKEEQE
ncbi:hypothetical protein [Thermocrinis jamiesonii]|uniref:hypothetical protein n=1 Tax=Thermocrinis jamiesonii TaxID=1302351 RepID=UPI000498220B|nr:hypothetical protein [Thermocrinis jamiesonii]